LGLIALRFVIWAAHLLGTDMPALQVVAGRGREDVGDGATTLPPPTLLATVVEVRVSAPSLMMPAPCGALLAWMLAWMLELVRVALLPEAMARPPPCIPKKGKWSRVFQRCVGSRVSKVEKASTHMIGLVACDGTGGQICLAIDA
tara:strand:+ start:471 stop:905 length:435 start_codon:yes stop_codon:yes gene_type:complete